MKDSEKCHFGNVMLISINLRITIFVMPAKMMNAKWNNMFLHDALAGVMNRCFRL